MVKLKLKKNVDKSQLETEELALGYSEITLLFNAGPFPGGGDCLIAELDGQVVSINSNDLIHDLPAYDMSKTSG